MKCRIWKNFLGGGELLLTALTVYEGLDEQTFLSHLERLNQKQVSGFIIKRRCASKWITKLYEVLLRFSEKHQIPLLELPPDLYYWGIIKHILLRIYTLETAKLTYFKITHDNVDKLHLDKYDVNEGMETIIQQSKYVIGAKVVLYDSAGNRFLPVDAGEDRLVLEKGLEWYVPDIITKNEYLRRPGENAEYIKKLDILDMDKFYLRIIEMEHPLEELDFIALENVITVLTNLLTRYVLKIEHERTYRSDLEYRLLNGSMSAAEEDETAAILNLKESDSHRVVTFYLKSESKEAKFNTNQRMETKIVEKIIKNFLPKEMVYYHTNQINYIHRESDEERRLEFRKKIEGLQQEVQSRLEQRGVKLEFLVGIGKSVSGYHRLKESFEDSLLAIKYIGTFRAIVGDAHKSVVDYSKIGFFRIFADMEDKEKLLIYIPESLQCLYQHELQRPGDLVDTLECYLNNNQSIKKTSELMHVHYRTVSYRLQKIVEISGMDFNNITEMLVVRNGLVILKIMNRI